MKNKNIKYNMRTSLLKSIHKILVKHWFDINSESELKLFWQSMNQNDWIYGRVDISGCSMNNIHVLL